MRRHITRVCNKINTTEATSICICIEYVVVTGKRFLYNGREGRPDFIGAGPLGRS